MLLGNKNSKSESTSSINQKRCCVQRNKFFYPFAILLSIVTISSSVFASPAETPRKIIVFKKSFSNKASQIALMKKNGAIPVKAFKIINGMSVYLPAQAQSALEKRLGDQIVRIEDDIVIDGTARKSKNTQPLQELPSQKLPWGIDRIEADIAWTESNGTMINVAILDTGANFDHLDLSANIKGNYNTFNSRRSAKDDHGHGTHVAGIIGAVNNTVGVIGVGRQVNLYPVKVLDRKNQGTLSSILDGLQWCIDNNMHVINMSFGALFSNQTLHDTIIAVHHAGIVQVAAAVNEGTRGGAILYPAKYHETIAVSSVNAEDQIASSSSWGTEIDISAPGVQINSTSIDGSYTTMSGTSMAAPHVTGTVALILAAHAELTPDKVKERLKNTADDLGLPSEKQGAGLVRADLAVY